MIGVQVSGDERTAVGIHRHRHRRFGQAAIQPKAQLLTVGTGDGSRFDRDTVRVDDRGPLGGPEVGVFPLGGQRLGTEFDDAQLEGSFTQHRVDAVKSLWPCQVRLRHTF